MSNPRIKKGVDNLNLIRMEIKINLIMNKKTTRNIACSCG
jgi:hypothetical protein